MIEDGALSGSSASGTVSVDARLSGGRGGAATGTANAGSGADASLTNKVDGSATDGVTLRQSAVGGASGGVEDGANGQSCRTPKNLPGYGLSPNANFRRHAPHRHHSELMVTSCSLWDHQSSFFDARVRVGPL